MIAWKEGWKVARWTQGTRGQRWRWWHAPWGRPPPRPGRWCSKGQTPSAKSSYRTCTDMQAKFGHFLDMFDKPGTNNNLLPIVSIYLCYRKARPVVKHLQVLHQPVGLVGRVVCVVVGRQVINPAAKDLARLAEGAYGMLHNILFMTSPHNFDSDLEESIEPVGIPPGRCRAHQHPVRVQLLGYMTFAINYRDTWISIQALAASSGLFWRGY